MNFTCLVGLHTWDGCKCKACGTVRAEGHDWSKNCEHCEKCGKRRNDGHAWNGCKCSKCGTIHYADAWHVWSREDCTKCARCGTTRTTGHDWTTDCEQCAKCGKTQANAHVWIGCKCSKCSKTRDEAHDWSYDCEKCINCGKTRSSSHKWNGCTCEVCGTARDQDHDWTMNCEKCTRCGCERENAHNWGTRDAPDSAQQVKCLVCGIPRSNPVRGVFIVQSVKWVYLSPELSPAVVIVGKQLHGKGPTPDHTRVRIARTGQEADILLASAAIENYGAALGLVSGCLYPVSTAEITNGDQIEVL